MPGSVAEADGWGLEIEGEGNGIRAVGPIQAEVDRMLAEVDRMLAEVNQKQGGPCGHKRSLSGRRLGPTGVSKPRPPHPVTECGRSPAGCRRSLSGCCMQTGLDSGDIGAESVRSTSIEGS